MNLPISTLNVEGVVEIPQCALYPKSQEAYDRLLLHLKDLGYEIKETGTFATLRNEHARCMVCHKEITMLGCHMEHRRCEHCGSLIWAELLDGATIEFTFWDNPEDLRMVTVTMKVKSYDPDAHTLTLYPDVLESKRGWGFDIEDSKKLLALNAHKFTKDGGCYGDYLVVPYKRGDSKVINTWEVRCENHIRLVETFKVWEGKEYKAFDDKPFSEHYNIYKVWNELPYRRNSEGMMERIMSAAGQVSRPSYYHQDRGAFSGIVYTRWRLFVENLTDIPVNEWDEFVQIAPCSGPGFIAALSSFCRGEKISIKDKRVDVDDNITKFALDMVTLLKAKEQTQKWHQHKDAIKKLPRKRRRKAFRMFKKHETYPEKRMQQSTAMLWTKYSALPEDPKTSLGLLSRMLGQI